MCTTVSYSEKPSSKFIRLFVVLPCWIYYRTFYYKTVISCLSLRWANQDEEEEDRCIASSVLISMLKHCCTSVEFVNHLPIDLLLRNLIPYRWDILISTIMKWEQWGLNSSDLWPYSELTKLTLKLNILVTQQQIAMRHEREGSTHSASLLLLSRFMSASLPIKSTGAYKAVYLPCFVFVIVGVNLMCCDTG